MQLVPLATLAALAMTAPTGSAQSACKPSEEGELVGSVSAAGDRFGAELARSGDTLAVSAEFAERVHLFLRGPGTPAAWTEAKLLTGPVADSDFGDAVALDGDTLAVGAPRAGAAGEVYLYERDAGGPGAWGLVKTLAAPAPSFASFGVELALEGDTLVVGSPYETRLGVDGAGAVYFFERDETGPGQWGLVGEATSPYTYTWGRFGFALAVEGGTAAVGEPWTEGPGNAYVYERGATSWNLARVLSSGLGAADDFGEALALQGDELAIGASKAAGGTVYVHARDQGGASLWGLAATATPPTFGGNFGAAVDFDGDMLAVAAPFRHNPTLSGRTFLFGRGFAGEPWGFMSRFKAGGIGAKDHFATALSLESGELVSGTGRATLQGAGSVFHYDSLPEFPYPYCSAGKTTNACAARLCASGTASASAGSGFVVTATATEGQKHGVFFFGTSGQQAQPWGNGSSFQCVVPPVVRAGTLSSGGTAGTCTGSFSQDLNALWAQQPQKNPGPGAVVQVQLWFRDPGNSSNQPTSLSDALQFPVAP